MAFLELLDPRFLRIHRSFIINVDKITAYTKQDIEIASILIVLSALFGYINVKFLKLPNTIGLMIVAILFTMGLFLTSLVNPALLNMAEELIGEIDFKTVLLDVMLGFLLFAGALHTNFGQLKVQR